jgi:hypothetical protein
LTHLLIGPPADLTPPELAAWRWAAICLDAALDDTVFLREHPDHIHSPELQRQQMLWLLEEHAQELIEGDDSLRGFVRAAERLAHKIRRAQGGPDMHPIDTDDAQR